MTDRANKPSVDEQFERIPLKDGKSVFRPKVPALVVSQSSEKGPNLMTAIWWTVSGFRPYKMLLAVAHETYTYEIIQENKEFVMAAPTSDMMDAVVLCGYRSGREMDKIRELDLELLPGDKVDVPLLAAASGNVECKIKDGFEYDGHTYYFAEVVRAYVKPGWFEDGVYTAGADPLLYLGVVEGEGGEPVRRHSMLPDERYEFNQTAFLSKHEPNNDA